MGQTVTWLAPHSVQQVLPADIDYSVLTTFMEFYKTLLHFVNFKLYHSLGVREHTLHLHSCHIALILLLCTVDQRLSNRYVSGTVL